MSKKKKKLTPKRHVPRGRIKPDKSKAAEYDYHLPVFRDLSVEYLINRNCNIYVDGTLGGGGHAALILKKLSSGGNLWAFDKDENAIEHCRIKFEEEINSTSPRLVLFQTCYSEACSKIKSNRLTLSGLLLDLGVSSMQLDTDQRGLSYRVNSRLDMRFGSEGISAEDLLNSISADELTKILRTYGEEPFAGPLARKIVEARKFMPLETTHDLRTIIEQNVPKQHQFKTLSRVFQAIRIAVNGELEVLEKTLAEALPLLDAGGRIVVISYHSLEDRIVKNFFKEHAQKRRPSEEDVANAVPKLKIITPKPLVPSPEEIEINPRSRSAKMRVAERV